MQKKLTIISVVSVSLDQITKVIIDSFLELGESVSVVRSFFTLTRVANTGAAFSILEGHPFALATFSIICLFLLLKYSREFKSGVSQIAFGLTFGGIIGNLIDRVFLGYVRDFLKFRIFGYNFPVFNLADSCIVIGIFLILICMFRDKENL